MHNIYTTQYFYDDHLIRVVITQSCPPIGNGCVQYGPKSSHEGMNSLAIY